MVLIAFLTTDWDCGLRRIQDKVQKYTITVMMGHIIRFLIVTCSSMFNTSLEKNSFSTIFKIAAILKTLKICFPIFQVQVFAVQIEQVRVRSKGLSTENVLSFEL
jgi:hypothetical protein